MRRQFSIREYVIRRVDGKVGQVKRVGPRPDHEDDLAYYVQFDPRDATPDNPDGTWAGWTDAWKRLPLHAHVEIESRDCDGRYTSGRVEEMTLEERCSEFYELAFKDRVLASTVSLHGHGTLRVTPDGLEWAETTDEGYRTVDVRWCDDECSHVRTWQRDHTAEANGY